MMSRHLRTVLLATALTAAAGSASALTIVGRTGDCATNPALGGCATSADRLDLGNVGLGGTGDGAFYSLGLGGSASFYFDRMIAGSLSVVEVTYGRSSYYDESAAVYGGVFDGTGYDFSTLLGTVTNKANGTGVSSLGFTGRYSALRFVDATVVPVGRGGDGYDLDAVNVSAAVPLPATALLLLGGLAGLGALRRRKG